MTENLALKEILDWYISAGVDETLGDIAFGIEVAKERDEKKQDKIDSIEKQEINIATASAPMPRKAITELAQTTVSALENARTICLRINSLEELKTEVEKYEGCALKLTASKTVFGDGNSSAKIMFVGEAPGADEDRLGLPFVGRSGHLLESMLKAIGVQREDCYITNVLPWRPPGNRTPTDAEKAVCLPFLRKQIDLINPDYIFILGGSAANALLEIEEPISKLRGRWLEYKNSNGKTIKVLASFHPAYLLRNTAQKAKSWVDLLRLAKNVDENKS